MSITHVQSVPQLDGILSKSKDKLTVIDFHATWCGPCHMIAPAFEALSKEYKDVNFLKCDVDTAKDVAAKYRVSAMPTFVFIKGGVKVDTVQGANRAGLEAAVRKHSGGASTGAFSGKGQTLAGPSPSQRAPAPAAQPRFDLANATGFANLDPQVKILLYLVAAYCFFWYVS